jgi:hypothetical protein
LTSPWWSCTLADVSNHADHDDEAVAAASVRGARLRIWTGAIVTLVVVGAACFTFWYRTVYNVMPGQGASDRVHWCGRDYEYEGAPLTRQQAWSQAGRPPQAEGSYPPLGLSRDELLAATYPDRQRLSTSCATLVFLRTGPDSYKPYSLEGGP